MKYSIDTSALIHGWHRVYAIENFPGFWDNLDYLIRNGDLRAHREVKEELERKDDDLFMWVKERDELFVEIDDEIQKVVTNILSQHERLLDTRKGRSGADPFVIALAQINNCAVVTQESFTNKMDRPNIPDVCRALKIKSLNLLQLIQNENWRF
jgi:hypothetical protein